LIRATSPEDITAASQQLSVVETVPTWMDIDTIARDSIKEPKSEALRLILAGGD
jgi:hypothetical protein